MAKVQYHQYNFQAAELSLNTILAQNKFKDSYEAIRMLAQIKARQKDKDSARQKLNEQEALKHFKRVIELNPEDFNAHFEISGIFEQMDPKTALYHYQQGIAIMRRKISAPDQFKFMEKWQSSTIEPDDLEQITQTMIPPELLNNLAVLQLETGNFPESNSLLQEAIQNCEVLLK